MNKRKYFAKYKLYILLTVISISFLSTTKIFAQEIDAKSLVNTETNVEEVDKIGETLSEYMGSDFNKLLPEYNPKTALKDIIFNTEAFDYKKTLIKICNYFFSELFVNLKLSITIVIIIVLSGIISNLKSSFIGTQISELAFYVCYITLISVLFISFTNVFNLARDIIESMVSFMYAMIPLLMTLLVTSGSITSSGLMYSIMIVLLEVSATLLKNFIIPLVLFSTVIALLNNISDQLKLSKLAVFIKQTCTYSLGIILTSFIAVLSIQGTFGSLVDGVTSKTAKFAINAFIPVVGKYIADATDAVLGCAVLIKNAAGISIMIGIISICLIPLIKILALIFVYKIMCGFLEPIADSKFTNCINEIANSLSYIFGITVAIAFMFLLSITFIISTSNVSSMIR